MGATHADLLASAEASAAAAREAEGPVVRREHAEAAKTALEAAALAQNVGPGEIDKALGEIQAELEEAGVLAESMELAPAEFLKATFVAVRHWRQEAAAVNALIAAHDGLRAFLLRLERDFVAGDSETSRRIAARIHTALEEAEQTGNDNTKEA